MPPKMIRSSRTVRSRQVRMLEPQASMDFKPVILILQCPISQKATCHRISDNHRDMEKVHKEEVQPWLWAARKGRRTKKALMCVNTGTKRDHIVRLYVCFALSCECVFATVCEHGCACDISSWMCVDGCMYVYFDVYVNIYVDGCLNVCVDGCLGMCLGGCFGCVCGCVNGCACVSVWHLWVNVCVGECVEMYLVVWVYVCLDV